MTDSARNALLRAIMLVAAAPATARDEPVPPFYELRFSVEESGKVLAEPAMLVESGKPASVSIERSPNAEGDYRLTVLVEPAKPDRNGNPQVSVSAGVAKFSNGRWEVLSEPLLLGPLDQRMSMSVRANDANAAPLVELSVLVSRSSRIEFVPRRD